MAICSRRVLVRSSVDITANVGVQESVDGAGNSGLVLLFFFSSRRRHTRFKCDWSSDVCSSDLTRTASRLVPKQFEYRYRLGAAYHAVGHFREAVEQLQQAVTLEPRHADAWNSLGLALQKSGDRPAALKAYRKAVELDPADRESRNNYGFMLVETGSAAKGIEEFERVLRADPNNMTAMVDIGCAYLRMGDLT